MACVASVGCLREGSLNPKTKNPAALPRQEMMRTGFSGTYFNET